MYARFPLADDKKGAKLTEKELKSISNSFDESFRSRLLGLSPASVSLAWLSSAVDVATFAHFSAKALIHELKMDGTGDNRSSLYLDNSLTVLDVCNDIFSQIERLRSRHLNLGIAIMLLGSDSKLSEEEIDEAKHLLALSGGEGGDGCVKSAGDIEKLIGDLATSIRMPVQWRKVSPADEVVRRAVGAVNFVTAFIAGVISSALGASSGAVIHVSVPEEFPWGDAVGAIKSAVTMDSGPGENISGKTRVLKELDDMETAARNLLKLIEEVAASGRGEEMVERLRVAVTGLETATNSMSEGLSRLKDGVSVLFGTVARTRKELADELTLSMRKPPLPKKPSKPGKNKDEGKAPLLQNKTK